MQNTIKFEIDDWVEIVEALGSKIRLIETGQLGPEDHPGYLTRRKSTFWRDCYEGC